MNSQEYSDEHIKNLIIAAKTDSMTGLLNHGASFGEMEKFLEDDTVSGTHALFMLDLDNFKKLNDTLGHQQGDAVLVNTADILKRIFNQDDIIGRIGGDEFLVLMKNVPSMELLHKKAQMLVSSLQFVCKQEDKESVTVSCSVGVVLCTGGKDTFSNVFHQADVSMYKAKKAGKNDYFIEQFLKDDKVTDDILELSKFDVISLHNLFENINVSVILFDAQNVTDPIYISPNYYKALNITPKSKMTTMEILEEIIHEDDKDIFTNFLNQHGEIKEVYYRIIDGIGHLRWRLARLSYIPTSIKGEFHLALVITDVTELKEHELAVIKSNLLANEYIKKLQMAFNPERQTMWEIDLHHKIFEISYWDNPYRTAFDETIADRLVKDNLLHRNYVVDFTKFVKKIMEGSTSGETIVKTKIRKNDLFIITKLKYTVLNDTHNEPSRVIGVAESIPDMVHELHHYLWENRFFESIQRNVSLQCKYNVTLDEIEILNSDGSLLDNTKQMTSYDEVQNSLTSGIVGSDIKQQFAMHFEKSNLQKLYKSGDIQCHMEQYHYMDGDNQSWVAMESKLLIEPIKGELILFVYGYHINRRKHISFNNETTMPEKYSYVIDTDDFKEVVDSLIVPYKYMRSYHVLVYINVIGVKGINGVIHNLSSTDLDVLYNQIRVLLKDDFIVGREKDGHLMLFKENVANDAWVMMLLEDTLAKVKDIFTPENGSEELILSAFVITTKTKEASYVSMLSKVYMLAEAVGDTIQNGGLFSSHLLDEDVRRDMDMLNKYCDEESTKELNESEKEVLNRISLLIVRGKSYKDYIGSVLHQIGMYYHADRVHLLKVIPSSQSMDCTDDWNCLKKFSVANNYLNRKLSDFPNIQETVISKASTIIKEGHREIAVPIFYADEVGGVLFIDWNGNTFLDIFLKESIFELNRTIISQ